MRTKSFLVFCCFLLISIMAKAQDSAKVAARLTELLAICKNVDFSDPKTSQLGLFYKAAPYIVYQGDDKTRKWKALADYTKADEKEQVDNICLDINQSVNQDPEYRITGFETNKESEGTWYVIHISYKKKDRIRNIAFAFLKIGDAYALGDID